MDANQVEKYIQNNSLSLHVRPGAPKTIIRGWDETREALRVDIAAQPENNKANVEVLKFFSKLLKKKVVLIRGQSDRRKVIRIEDDHN